MASSKSSSADTIRHFLATTDDYEALRATFPLPPNVDAWGFPDEQTRWVVRLHALLLRKYFASRDALYLPKVVDALQACADLEKLPIADWGVFRDSASTPPQTGVRVTLPDGRSFDESTLLENELYGRFLHGDFEKWAHTQAAGDDGSDALIYMATWNRASHVRWFAEFLRDGIAKGTIDIA